MKIYSSVFLSPGNPWWVVESHTRSVLLGIMRPVRRAAMSWSQYARPTKESRVGPVGILKMFAMTPRRSWKHELEWQEKPETWHTRTWCGAEQGTRSLISGWGWRRSLARWEPKGRAAALGEQGWKCQFPAVGDTRVLAVVFPLPVFTFVYSCLFPSSSQRTNGRSTLFKVICPSPGNFNWSQDSRVRSQRWIVRNMMKSSKTLSLQLQVHLLPSPLGCVIFTFLSLTLSNFPSTLGMGKALAARLQPSVQQVGAHPGPGSGKLSLVSHLWELLRFLLTLRNYWSCWNREWWDHTVTLRMDERF